MIQPVVICKYCRNSAVVKYGTFEGMQRYFCKTCRRKFADNDALPKMKTPIWVIASALNQYYDGKSLSTIQGYLHQRYGAIYARTSIYNWVVRFSNEALKLSDGYVPQVGDTWLVHETSLYIGRKKIWLRDCVDSATSYLLDTSLSTEPQNIDIGHLAEKLSPKAGRSASLIIYTASNEKEQKTEVVWYKTARDINKQTHILKIENENIINRFVLSLKTRRAVLRGLKNIETACRLVATWQVHYNFFRSFTTLGHTPPAQTMPGAPFSSWLDLINLVRSTNNPLPPSLLQNKRILSLPPEAVKELPLKGKYR